MRLREPCAVERGQRGVISRSGHRQQRSEKMHPVTDLSLLTCGMSEGGLTHTHIYTVMSSGRLAHDTACRGRGSQETA